MQANKLAFYFTLIARLSLGFSPTVLCRRLSLHSRGPECQTYLPPVCPFQQRDNQRGLILCPNKLIPPLTRKSKVQGRMQILEGLTEPKLALNQLMAHTETQTECDSPNPADITDA